MILNRLILLPAALLAVALPAFGVGTPPRALVSKARQEEGKRTDAALDSLMSKRESIGLDKRHGFSLKNSHTDDLGQTHARFQQTFNGVKVWGGMVIAHTDVDGAELEVTNAAEAGIDIAVAPTFGDSDALNLAHRDLQPKGGYVTAPTAELVIFPETMEISKQPGKPTEQLNAIDIEHRVLRHILAWHVHAEVENPVDGNAHTDYLIDAHGGAILKKWDSLQTGRAVGTGASQYSGSVQIETNDLGTGSFELRDTTRGTNGGNYTADRALAVGNATIFVDADNQWGDGVNFIKTNPTTGPNGQTAAVDAHYGLMKTWDYYRFVHNRNGIDGIGTQTFNRVHSADPNTPTNINYDNAFWSESCFCMTYGDGSFTVSPNGFTTLTAVDVAGHEMSHGVTSRTSNLIYANESGGLNESNSDIHGTMVEFYLKGGSGSTIGDTGGNYTIGEQLNAIPLRYMYKPSKDGSSADAWFAGVGKLDVHFSSGPMNRAFYFMARGALATAGDFFTPYLPSGMIGIGNDKSARIWYRAMTAYLTPGSNYIAARTASVRAAGDLYGYKSVEVDAVKNAFAGINVGYTASTFDDIVPPTIRVLVDNQPSAVTFTAEAVDNLGIATVELYIDGALTTTLGHSPFVYSVNPLQLASGNHTVIGIAYDVAGNSTPSRPVNFAITGPAQLLVNPGFETGPASGACRDTTNNIDTCTPGWTSTLDVINFGVTGTHSGVGYAYLVGYGTAHVDTVDQSVSLPASLDHATLSFYGFYHGAETTGADTATLQLRDNQGAVIATLASWSFPADYSSTYVQRMFDLTPYKGQSFHVFLTATENGSLISNVKVDDFAVNVSATPDAIVPVVTASLGQVGTTLKMMANVLDDGFITKVDFYLDGAATPTVTATNGTFMANVPAAFTSPGGHSFIAKATDAAGNVGTSAQVNFVFDSIINKIVNGGFETATGTPPITPWVLTTSITGAGCNNVGANAPRTGTRNALLGGCGAPSTATLTQDIALPPDIGYASFTFWLRIFNGWADGQQHDSLVVQIRNTSDTVLQTLGTFSNKDDTAGLYVQRLYPNLLAYKGTTIRLALVSTQDVGTSPSGFSRFRMDDFSLSTSVIPDTTAPVVTGTITGMYATLAMTATVADNRTGSRVDFLIDGNVVATGGCCAANGTVLGTFNATYDSTQISNGLHVFQARGVDTTGNIGLSAPITFLVANVFDAIPPSVTVAGQSSFEEVSLSASATDNVGVVGVDFLVDGRVVGGSTSAPWVVETNWTTLGGTSHVVTARAFDAIGNTGTSAPITITRPTVIVTAGPSALGLLAGASVSLTANVTGASNGSVTWSVLESNAGTITAGGVYTAPATIGDYHVIATSAADTSKSSSILIRVYTGDENGDVLVDGLDMGVFAAAFGSSIGGANYNAQADLDANGTVDDADLNLFLAQFGR